MERINNVEMITTLLDVARSGSVSFSTNYFFSLDKAKIQLRRGLYYKVIKSVLFFFQKENGCARLFWAGDLASLASERMSVLVSDLQYPLAVDILGRESNITDLSYTFESLGFRKHSKLVRSNRPFSAKDEMLVSDNRVVRANKNDLPAIRGMYDLFFEPITDRLPDDEEIFDAISDGNVKVIREGDRAVAFHWGESSGSLALSRYACVLPEARKTGAFFALTNDWIRRTCFCKRRNIWVRENNRESNMAHLIYGFKPDGLVDQVMVKMED